MVIQILRTAFSFREYFLSHIWQNHLINTVFSKNILNLPITAPTGWSSLTKKLSAEPPLSKKHLLSWTEKGTHI